MYHCLISNNIKSYTSVVFVYFPQLLFLKSPHCNLTEVFSVKVKFSMAKSIPVEDLLPQNVGSIINYLKFTEVTQWGAPRCSQPQPATDNAVRDGRSNWLVAPPTLHRAVPPEFHVLHTAMRAGLRITRLTALSELRTCDLQNARPTHCLCGRSGYNRGRIVEIGLNLTCNRFTLGDVNIDTNRVYEAAVHIGRQDWPCDSTGAKKNWWTCW